MNALMRLGALLPGGQDHCVAGPIGIDFSLDFVHLVQLERSAAGLTAVRAQCSVPFGCPRSEILGGGRGFRNLIRRALASGPFRGRKAVVAMPSGMFRTVSVNYKAGSSEAADGAAILDVMKDRLDGDLADYVLDYLPVRGRSRNDERLAMVAVGEKRVVVDFLELLRTAGLEVAALEIGPVATRRLVARLSEDPEQDNCLIVNAGRGASYLTLISGTDLLLDQEVAFGENALVSQAAEVLDMPESMIREHLLHAGFESSASGQSELGATMAEILKPHFLKLAEEIRRACMYAAAETRGSAIAHAYLLGSVARWPGSEALLASVTGLKVGKIPDPLALFTGSADGAKPTASAGPAIAVATGAALRGV